MDRNNLNALFNAALEGDNDAQILMGSKLLEMGEEVSGFLFWETAIENFDEKKRKWILSLLLEKTPKKKTRQG